MLENKVNIHGKVILNTLEEKVYSKLHINANNDANLTLYAQADKKRLDYKLVSNKDITHIRELVAIFKLPKEIKFWTMDAIDAPSLTIHRIKGFVEYAHFKSAYRNIYVSVTVNKLNYTYNTKLDAIHTQRTELEFFDGILYIRPKKAYSYGIYLDRSWLKINFTKKDELLTLYLLFDGMLNKDMLHILNTYNIKLPFLQHSGKVKTDLKIAVNLKSIKINAEGDFSTKKANFDYLGLNIDIADTFIKLHNYDVDITKMKARYKNIAKANVTVQYNAKKAVGDINFSFTKIKLNKQQYLDTTKGPLKAIYKIAPKGDKIIAEKSNWNIENFQLTLDALNLPFDLKKLQVSIPPSFFSIGNIADGYVSGKIDMKPLLFELKTDLLHFQYKGIKLAQSNALFTINYKKHLSIKSQNKLFLNINESVYKIKKLTLNIDKNKIILKKTKFSIGNFITTEASAKYYFRSKSAQIYLKKFLLINPKNKTKLYYNDKFKLTLQTNKNNVEIKSKSLNADFILKNDRWILNINSIATISQNSKFLQDYKITNGTLSIYKKDKEKYTKFKGNINYDYKLLTDKDKVIQHYNLAGYITKKEKIYLTINKKLHINISDKININLKNGGINNEDLLKFIDLISSQNKQTSPMKEKTNIFFKAKNSYIYLGNNRYIVSNLMSMQYYNGVLTAQLQYANGKAGFKLKDDVFHLYGQNFNDTFMENLFSLSKFRGGSLDFSMSGTFKEYKGAFYIQNTTIQDYILLNNILAFINTVPSLATFSLPQYSKNGLHIDNAYMRFKHKNHIFDISDIYIGSKELKILGKGTASVKYNNIDLTLNLKTDIGSNLSKIPVVGYLIFDGQSLSTTLKVSGKLTDPKVKTMIARDVAVAPLNIIQRTLTLPYKLLKDVSNITIPDK